MKVLPNGVTIYNCTLHPLTFWTDGWEKPIDVEPDMQIRADSIGCGVSEVDGIQYLTTEKFIGNDEGKRLIEKINRKHPEAIIVGSIITAQAYPGDVVAMVPVTGCEGVPQSQKMAYADKFIVYPKGE